MNSIIMSTEKYELSASLMEMGFDIIPSEYIGCMLPFEARHADMQCLRINDTVFVLNECEHLIGDLKSRNVHTVKTKGCIGGRYPNNVLLNAVYFHNRLYCKESALDCTVKDYCIQNDIEIINVNQGYTKCSTAIINDKFVTSDRGIFQAMRKSGEEGALISPGHIRLDGVDYGFIGGACFEDEKNVFFTGDIKKHPDYDIIKSICGNKNIICMSDDIMYDIGGFVSL